MAESRFFVSSDGSMYRDNNFSAPFRENFKYTHAHIKNPADFKATVRNGAYAWPGGYPMFFITSDGAALCFGCAKKEAWRIIRSIRERQNDGWRVERCDINYEDRDRYCDHCSERIESAYGEDEDEGDADKTKGEKQP
jgi:hypothetical protein